MGLPMSWVQYIRDYDEDIPLKAMVDFIENPPKEEEEFFGTVEEHAKWEKDPAKYRREQMGQKEIKDFERKSRKK